MKLNIKEVYSVRVKPSLMDEVDAIADLEECYRSDVIRIALETITRIHADFQTDLQVYNEIVTPDGMTFEQYIQWVF